TGVALTLALAACSTAATPAPSVAPSPSPAASASAAASPSPVPSPSPSPSAALAGKLRFFGYTDAFDPLLLKPFQDAHPDLTIEPAAIASDTGAGAKLKGRFAADMVNTCAGPIDQEIADGSLQPIDTSRIDAWDTIYPFFKSVPGVTGKDGKV